MSPISLMNIEFCLKNGSTFISPNFCRVEVVGRFRWLVVGVVLAGSQGNYFFFRVIPFLYMEALGFPVRDK